jgi:hypothetical protein
MIEALLRQLDDTLPSSFEETITLTHQREGAMTVIDSILSWEPESVTVAKNKAAAEGKPVEDDND